MLQLTTLPRRILDHPLGRRIALGSLGTFVVRGLGAVATVGSAALLARLLGPRDYGIYAYAVSWALLLGTIAGLGLDVLATREIAQARARGEPGTVRAFVRWSTRLVALTGSAAALLIAAVGLLVPAEWKPEAAAGLAWVAPAALAIAGLRLVQGLLQGSGRVVLSQAFQSLALPLQMIVVALTLQAANSLNSTTAVLSYALLTLVTLGVAVLTFRDVGTSTSCRSPSSHPLWQRSAFQFATTNAVVLASAHLGPILAGSLFHPEAAGQFDLSMKLAQFSLIPLMALMPSMQRTLAELCVTREYKTIRTLIQTTCLLFMTFGLIITTLLALASITFASSEYSSTVLTITAILMVGQTFYATAAPMGWLILMSGHEKQYLRAQAVALLAYILACLILSSPTGPLTVALAFTASRALLALQYAHTYRQHWVAPAT